MPVIYERLRALAHRQVAQEQHRTCTTHDLVHEAFFQLFDRSLSWKDRAHFFAYAAQAMRHLLVDRARQRHSAKRGANQINAPLDEALEINIPEINIDFLDLESGLQKMQLHHPRLVKIIELRFFAGLNTEEIAQCLEVHESTIERDWVKARALLHHELQK
jgi:RNA polymerase sigma factor (TIGR02999 family)